LKNAIFAILGEEILTSKVIADEQIANRLLLALAPVALKQLLPHFKRVEFGYGEIVYRPGDVVTDVCFINRGLLSLVKTMRDGRTVEVNTRGIDGVTAPASLFGFDTTILECVVQVPASGFSIRASVLRSAMARSRMLNGLIQRYTHLAVDQLAQTAACNRLHSLEERCCRRLLIAHDNARANTFPLTHEFLAGILGVRRPQISTLVGSLRKSGCIRYGRGLVTVADRAGLEARACECYEFIRRETDHLLACQS
jgi:CRP-like cAMP-binding protein